jgi:hypothetical protein
MNKSPTRLALFVVLLLLLGVVAWKAGSCSLRECQKVYRIFFPPPSYFTPLAESIIRVDAAVINYVLTFRNIFPGAHVIGLHLSNVPQDLSLFDPGNVGVYLEIVDSDGSVKMKVEGRAKPGGLDFGWLSAEDVLLLLYDVPRDLGKNVDFECRLTVTHGDPEFQSRYGPVRLYVVKSSDM